MTEEKIKSILRSFGYTESHPDFYRLLGLIKLIVMEQIDENL